MRKDQPLLRNCGDGKHFEVEIADETTSLAVSLILERRDKAIAALDGDLLLQMGEGKCESDCIRLCG
jgi:hypothetical protein